MSDRRKILRVAECDTDRLYGSLKDAAAYLLEMAETLPDGATLEEHWWDYEEMEIRFSWYSSESDEEMKQRLEMEKLQRKINEAERKREAERSADLDRYRLLQKKLGFSK